MDFLAQQDAARRASRWLIVAFMVAIVLIVLAVHGVLLLLWQWMAPGQPLPPHFALTNATVVLLIILGGAAVEIWRLRRGGQVVAEMAGGTRISPDTNDCISTAGPSRLCAAARVGHQRLCSRLVHTGCRARAYARCHRTARPRRTAGCGGP